MTEERKIVGIVDKIPMHPETLEYATAEELEGKSFYFIEKLRCSLYLYEDGIPLNGIIHLSINRLKVSTVDGKIPKIYQFEGVCLTDLKPEDKKLFDKYAKNIKESHFGKDFVDCEFNIEEISLLTASVWHYCSEEDYHGSGMKVTYETRN